MGFGQGALPEPVLEGLDGGDLDGQMIHRLGHGHRGAPQRGRSSQGSEGRHWDRSLRGDFLALRLVAEAEQEIGDRNVHRADFVASTAERGGFRKVGEFRETFPEKDGREHRTNRAAVDRAIGVAGCLSVNGADILAGGATDAAQDFPAVRGEHIGAPVVHEDDVHVLRAVRLVLRFRTIDKLGVNGQLLAGGGATEEVEENGEVALFRDDLLDTDEGNVKLVRCHAETRVTLVRNEGEPTGVGADEVRSGDTRLGGHVFLTEVNAGAAGDRFWIVVVVRGDALAEEGLRDTAAVLVDDGLDDVGWLVAIELDDELSKIRLQAINAVLDKERVEVDLLGRHRLGFRQLCNLMLA